MCHRYFFIYWFMVRSSHTEEIIDPSSHVYAASSTSENSTIAGIVDYTNANSYIGKNATVQGMPVRIYTSAKGTVFFDYCINYKNCPFSVVIFADDAKKFANIMSYQNTNISVTGLLKSYNGHAEIAVTSPSQIN